MSGLRRLAEERVRLNLSRKRKNNKAKDKSSFFTRGISRFRSFSPWGHRATRVKSCFF